jgi:predicted amidophosphoribosyltransferase
VATIDRRSLQRILEDVTEALFPSACRHCGTELADPPAKVPRAARPHAPLWDGRVRRPLVGAATLPLRILCPACCATLVAPGAAAALPATGVPVVAAFEPGPALFELIHAIKYEAKTELVPHLSAFLARAARRTLGRSLCLVPVPLHETRLRSRGFNQSALLAQGVAARLGVPVLERVLQRTRATAPQARLPAAARAANVAGAFCCGVRLPEGESCWVLVDDVVTTGATALAALAALGVPHSKAAVLTLCHARAEAPGGLPPGSASTV